MGMLNLSPGDHALVINGRQTSAFDARVTEVGGGTITVFVTDKDAYQTYNLDGSAVGGTEHGGESRATLVPEDHGVGRFLNMRRKHRLYHMQVMQATKNFRENPSRENGVALSEATEWWRRFVDLAADRDALVAHNLDEYLRIRTNS